jgi:hypothetical protein
MPCFCPPCIPSIAPAVANAKSPASLEESAIRILPPKLAKGELGRHYRVGWDEQKKAGHSLIDESKMQDLPDRMPEGAVLPGHYDPASGHTESLRGMPGSEAGVIPSLPPGSGRQAMSQIAHKKRIGAEAVEEKGWLRAHKWLILRRISQFGILGLFLLGPTGRYLVGQKAT